MLYRLCINKYIYLSISSCIVTFNNFGSSVYCILFYCNMSGQIKHLKQTGVISIDVKMTITTITITIYFF